MAEKRVKKAVKKKVVKKTKKKVVKKTTRKKISRKIKSISISKEKLVKKTSKISKKKSERVSTGIKNFDSLIETGFPKNSTNVVVGASGSGKSIFVTQYLMEGLRKGESCLYVTFEEKKGRFFKNMSRFGWNLEEAEKKGKFTFLEYTPIKVKTMLEEGGGAIENVIIKNKVSRIVIDSMTSFALLFEDELSKRQAALSLFNMINTWSCTSLLTIEENPKKKDKTTQSIEFEADSIILFYFDRENGERERYLEVLKMRGTKHSKKVYQFEINEKGIDISGTPTKNPPV